MEQRPIPGHDPLPPPAPNVARAYLDEIDAVVERREAFIDRRRMAWLSCAEAVVLAVYLTLMMFSFGSAVSSPFLVLVALLFVWLQLSAELRESYGGQLRLSGTSQWVYLAFGLFAALAVMVGVGMQIAGVSIPVLLKFVPGAALLAVFGGRAVRDIRRSPEPLPRERLPFTRGARYATFGLGLVIGFGIWVTASEHVTLVAIIAPLIMVFLLGWGLAGYLTDKVPALGAIWRWPQWAAFALSTAALAALMMLAIHSDGLTGSLAGTAGVGAAALFAGVAFVGGRDAR